MIKHDDKWLGLFLTMSANFQVNMMISSSYYFDNFWRFFNENTHICQRGTINVPLNLMKGEKKKRNLGGFFISLNEHCDI